jgi:hypothetical protein
MEPPVWVERFDGRIAILKFAPIFEEDVFDRVKERPGLPAQCFRPHLPLSAGQPSSFAHQSRSSFTTAAGGPGLRRVCADTKETKCALGD